MHNLDYNYLYYLADKSQKEECPNYRSIWLGHLKEHIQFLDMQEQKKNQETEQNLQEYINF